MIFPNERPVIFDIGNGYQKKYFENSLWYDRYGLIHYIKFIDSNGIEQVYTLMEKETDVGKRKRILSNLVKIASIAYGGSGIYNDYQQGKIDGGGIVLRSIYTIHKGNKNASNAKKLADFLYGGTEKDTRMEYYNIDTAHVWHDKPLHVKIDTYDQNRFDAYPAWVFDE